jgi:hypothetical protein
MVERPAQRRWYKSTRSGSGDCVEVAMTGGKVHVRDSKAPGGPMLSFTVPDWASFVHDVRSERFS